ncbi:CGNR zinc finger domain-containing protein [Amycolatopsis magusensis]|uniref:RNA-binding Zn ribbon-like protein n=1 Tax=Amycolatopsis magusensis TaxID=882444 RepID=A0ABS4PHW1_9PSEU|nr:CGNR zinc finger domain-containing protein [Amycolatopsis magusensis]MBP2178948.1 putative RNA-binding Zn ribbon-like protein [Amycolatopsis magusensis]
MAPLELPEYLEPVLAFVNSMDVEEGTDELTDASALTTWLASRFGVDSGPASAREFRLALSLRSTLRGLALANHADVEPVDVSCFARLPFAASSGPDFEPQATDPIMRALTQLAIGYARAQAAGSWQRLRLCPGDNCYWAFWDSSPRGARRWCSMRVCGNRAKARTYATRPR